MLQRLFLAITLTSLAITLSGCIKPYQPPIQQGNILTAKNVNSIHRGMTSQQVIKTLGGQGCEFDGKIYPVDKQNITDKSTLRSTWASVRNFSRFPEVRGSVKKYLTANITGEMIEVHPTNWKSAIFLPVQKFVGATERTVYKDTMEKPERKRRMSVSTAALSRRK